MPLFLNVKTKKLHEDAVIPKYQTEGSAGFDLVSVEEHYIGPGETAVVGTGLAFQIPLGYEMQVRPRSGLAAKHGITVLNAPGTIDSDYRGEVKVILHNTNRTSSVRLEKGDRIAQGVVQLITTAQFVEVEELSASSRGAGGFGSTGN